MDARIMNDRPSRPPSAGGFLIAMSLLVGTVLGFMNGQTTIGFLIGLAVGVALSVAIWLRTRG
ncbi:hypothetical protein [Sphingomonas sp. TZW2008]|uniref:hypothetical protein n=1 Tax=Sphingomonas sp. TZW2008 TaxID=1917973 RepID=UPI000A26BC93|nr:hypothetical protein [Sphingomonas sp. TZW2008]